MATREFNSPYVYDLADKAITGIQNHRLNEWRKECRNNYPGYLKRTNRRNSSWLSRLLRRKTVWVMTFEEYVEDRKTWLASEYSDTYTFWDEFLCWKTWDKTESQMVKIKQIAMRNDQARSDTKLDSDEYHLLLKYSVIELDLT